MPVEVLAGSVVAHRCSRVGVAGGDLDVAEGYSGVERGHDERGSQHVGMDAVEACLVTDRADPIGRRCGCRGGVISGPQDRSGGVFTEGEVEGAVRGTTGMPAGLLFRR